jgi:hypothetical protein
VERVGAASARSGKAAARQERARGPGQDGAEAAGAAHMVGRAAAARAEKKQRRERER